MLNNQILCQIKTYFKSYNVSVASNKQLKYYFPIHRKYFLKRKLLTLPSKIDQLHLFKKELQTVFYASKQFSFILFLNKNIMEPVPTSRFISKLVKQMLTNFITKAFPDVKGQILLQQHPKGQFDYVSPTAIKFFNMYRNKKQGTTFGCKNVEEFAKKIAQSKYQNDVIGDLNVNQQGFLQINLKDSLVQSKINEMIFNLDYPELQKQKITVDFSSPNIAKEMHVGHLRSTIIGQSTCRLLEYMGNQVHRINHVGDWGTQFGMLIAYMKETFPDYETKTPEIKDLDDYYKAARKKFDQDPEFKKKSQLTVVELQSYDQSCIKAWKSICEISRQYFNQIYVRLGIKLEEFGESFYNPFIPAMLKELEEKNMIVEDDTKTKKFDKKGKKGAKKEEKQQQPQQIPEEGQKVQGKKAKCVFVKKYTVPLIVVKSDGGYNYDTTDMTAIKYRLQTLKANRLIYVTDSGQQEHFLKVFEAARMAGWLTDQRVDHMGFGVVLGEDGKKFSTRKGVAVKLMDLINEAQQKALQQLKSREKDEKTEKTENTKEQVFTALKPEEYLDAAEKLGIASIKYYDLRQNRKSDYEFNYDKMLDPRGNTAIYLIYAYVRMCSIIRKSGLTSQQIVELAKNKPFKISHADEKVLAAMIVKFFDVVTEASDELAINKVTDFIYDIAVKVQENYKKYKIVGDQNMDARIILVETVRAVLEKAFYMVGIVPIEKI